MAIARAHPAKRNISGQDPGIITELVDVDHSCWSGDCDTYTDCPGQDRSQSEKDNHNCFTYWPWASYKIRKIAGWACTGNAGNVSPPSGVSDPDMHHVTCVTHVPWCILGSLTSGFLRSRWRGKRRGKRPRHSRRMCNSQFYVFGKRPIQNRYGSVSENKTCDIQS